VHFDVMDGHFVPNITYGAPVLKCLKKAVPEAFYDVHLMISDPARYHHIKMHHVCTAHHRIGRFGGKVGQIGRQDGNTQFRHCFVLYLKLHSIIPRSGIWNHAVLL